MNSIFSEKEMKLHNLYMDLAIRISQMSYAVRKKVGCIAVRNGRITSMGWNGMPSGFDNVCEETVNGELVTKREVLHAELNLFSKIATSNDTVEGADLYVTLSPCFECSKLIMQTKIKRVFYNEEYRDASALEFLQKAGIEVYYLKEFNEK